MDVVIDADILSTFAKINGLELLQRLFSKSAIIVTPSVRREIRRAQALGIIDHIRLGEKVRLTLAEKKLVGEIREGGEVAIADAECLAVAKNRKCLLLTNDRRVQREAVSLSVGHLSLPLLLREMWRERVVPKQRVVDLMEEIEKKDRIVIKNKEEIFK